MVAQKKKVALVTGASSGIGYDSSIELAKRGYKVYAGARRLEAMKPLEEYGITPIKLDVTSIESVLAAKQLIESEYDHLDVLFSNAGIPCGSPAIELSDEEVSKVLEVNLHAPIRLTREFSDLVIKAKGVFAYTSSTGGLLPFPFGSIYSTSKAGLSAFTSTLAIEVKPFGVKVIDFVSGGVQTALVSNDNTSLKPGSKYIVDGKDLFAQSQNFDTSQFMDCKKYSAKVVDDIESALGGGSGLFSGGNYFKKYRGTHASTVLFVTSFFPRAILENILIGQFKLVEGFKALTRKYVG